MRATESARSENARNLSRFFNESGYTKEIQLVVMYEAPSSGLRKLYLLIAVDQKRDVA
jgi:hypothetical protein